MSARPCIQFDRVCKQIGGRTILDCVDLAIPEHTTTAVVGESGSGKSSLLLHVLGLLRPDTGRVEVLGEPIDYAALPRLRRRIGYAVQGIGLFPHLSIADNVTLMARLEGWSTQRTGDRLRYLLELMELAPEIADRYPHGLSGGQQQRAGLARALMLEPELLLLDEPFSGLDPLTRAGIHEEFLRIRHHENVSVVLVTHDMNEAIKLGSHLVIIGDGRILQQGTNEEVLASPADQQVARLLGSRHA